MEIVRFITRIILNHHDAEKYNGVVHKICSLQTDAEQNSYYEQVLKVENYSYDVKQKAVFWLYTLQQARLWGFKNLSGEALFIFAQEHFNNGFKELEVEDLQALVSNPAFAGSVDSDFDVPKMIFVELFNPSQPEKTIRGDLLTQLVFSPTMNIGIAELIVNLNTTTSIQVDESIINLNAISQPTMLRQTGAIDDSSVIDWTRKTYDMGDVPDSWVRKFLMYAM
jgi:hypothetical protein